MKVFYLEIIISEYRIHDLGQSRTSFLDTYRTKKVIYRYGRLIHSPFCSVSYTRFERLPPRSFRSQSTVPLQIVPIPFPIIAS